MLHGHSLVSSLVAAILLLPLPSVAPFVWDSLDTPDNRMLAVQRDLTSADRLPS